MVDGEGRETEGLMLAKGVHGAGSAVLATTALGNEQPVVRQGILVGPALETGIVDVGSQTQQLWGTCVPEVDEMGQRTC